MYLGTFQIDCQKFNEMYKLSAQNENLKYLGQSRLEFFKQIFSEEVSEVNEILDKASKAGTDEEKLEVLTDLSDWLGDLVVYAMTEGGRWGLPMDHILQTIMQSNFSKLGADGKPIYDERGKVLKGPTYWKPEPKISELLRQIKFEDLSSTNNIVFA